MAGVKRQPKPTVFKVVVSHDGLNVGEVFSQQPDDLGWALARVEAGYLEIVPEEASDAGEEG